MAALILITADQLSPALSSLRDIQPGDQILLAEVAAEAHYAPHHQLKIVLLFSAMRHFAAALQAQGHRVHYVDYDQQVPSLLAAVQQVLQQQPQLQRVRLTELAEYRLMQEVTSWPQTLGLPVDVIEDDRFICNHAMFRRWADGRQSFRMEYFYREMRRYTGLLMDGNTPAGGQWNFDAENRQACPAEVQIQAAPDFKPDAITLDVIALVQRHFASHMGQANQFVFAVTGKDARAAFLHFLQHRLPLFGKYQDAMRQDEPFLFHSLVSMYLNCGLLDARWLCLQVEQAWKAGLVPLNAAEGFIRQIIGWREYVRGLYWLRMPEYRQQNFFAASRPLPSWYWTGQTRMNCLSQAIGHTIRHAYSHHIQRLMLTGNFALLAGLSVDEMTDWYLAVYADAYEWVELPNTLGMALFADGGLLASKPYAASGNYIAKMSNYCQHCDYDVKQSSGERACPFNALYWDFIARHEDKLGNNARMQLTYQQWRRKSAGDQQLLRAKAAELLIHLEQL